MASELSPTTRQALASVLEHGTVSGLSDAQLLERFADRRDNGASFEALLARHGPMVLGVCRALVRDPHLAEDAFQATFLVLVRKAGSIRVDDSLGRWLYGVATRVARRAQALQGRAHAREAPLPDSGVAGDGAPDPSSAEDRRLLHEEIARLPERDRAALVLCHLEGVTHEEAARRLRWPVGTVRSRLARGRERLRSRLVRRGVAPAGVVALLSAEATAGTVPVVLAKSTLRAALAVRAGRTAALASTLSTLIRGAITSMAYTKLQMGGLALLTSGTLVLAGASVLARQESKGAAKGASRGGGITATPPEFPQAPPSYSGGGGRTPVSGTTVPRPDVSLGGEFGLSVGGMRATELGARLNAARKRLHFAMQRHETGTAPQNDLDEAQGDVEILEAQIAGLRDEIEEAMELIEVRIRARELAVRRAEMSVKDAMENLDRMRKLREKLVISEEDMQTSSSRVADADFEMKLHQCELGELEVRKRQLQRRMGQVAAIAKPVANRPQAPAPAPAGAAEEAPKPPPAP